MAGTDWLQVDIELTNRCNADCYFCPRDATPHQGLMKPDVFDQALARAVEFRQVAAEQLEREVWVALCGLGEPLLNKHAPEFTRKVVDQGFLCGLSTNGALLDEKMGVDLLDAGLKRIHINVSEQGDDYEQVYKLPWERTRDNVIRFAAMAEGKCEVNVVLVNHRGDPDHGREMQAFWREHGIRHFHPFEVINRGGALFVDHMQYEEMGELTKALEIAEQHGGPQICGVPFGFIFIGYDGQYYLCCSDWKKEAPLGSVFERSMVDVSAAKLAHVSSREPVCRSCNHDPLNQLVDVVRAEHVGDVSSDATDEVIQRVVYQDGVVRDILRKLGQPDSAPASRAHRKLIPVRAD